MGPIPEGFYEIKQSDMQFADDRSTFDKMKGVVGKGTFRGGERAWGEGRVWLTPYPTTETYGRSGFTIHGGAEPGSAGCIDLTNDILSFLEEFASTRQNWTLEARYPSIPED